MNTVQKPTHSIERPAHYTQGRIEVLDFIEDQQLGFCAGNVIEYVCRYRSKGTPLKDLQKARVYLDRLITALKPEGSAK